MLYLSLIVFIIAHCYTIITLVFYELDSEKILNVIVLLSLNIALSPFIVVKDLRLSGCNLFHICVATFNSTILILSLMCMSAVINQRK